MTDWYDRYRALSLEVHPGWRRLLRAFTEAGAGLRVLGARPTDLRDLAFASTVVSQLGLLVECDWQPRTRTGLVYRGTFDEYLVVSCLLNVFTRPGAVTIDTLFYVPSDEDLLPS